MKPKTAPTSPKYPLEQAETLKQVWQEPSIQPPARIPLVSLALWSFIFGLVAVGLLLAGMAWYLKWVPNSRLKDFLPATVTTIIENTSGVPAEPPNAVKQLGDTVLSLVVKPSDTGVATDAQLTGTALALSSGGWAVTLNDALPSATTVAAASSQRDILATDAPIADPATPFVYLKTDSTNLKAADFVSTNRLRAGQTVWVVVRRLTSSVAVRRQLIPASQGWQACDRFSARWVLDEPVTAPVGAPVVTDNGQVVGLLGASNAVWSVDLIDPVLKGLFEHQAIERFACGFHYLPSQAAAAVVAPKDGIIVGASNGTVAVEPKGPADIAGLRAGDVITAVNNQPVDDWTSVTQSARPGQALSITVRRGTDERTMTLTLGLLRP